MVKILGGLISSFLIFIFILFSIMNADILHLNLWPSDYVLSLPLPLFALFFFLLGAIIGVVLTWRYRGRKSQKLRKEMKKRQNSDIHGPHSLP